MILALHEFHMLLILRIADGEFWHIKTKRKKRRLAAEFSCAYILFLRGILGKKR